MGGISDYENYPKTVESCHRVLPYRFLIALTCTTQCQKIIRPPFERNHQLSAELPYVAMGPPTDHPQLLNEILNKRHQTCLRIENRQHLFEYIFNDIHATQIISVDSSTKCGEPSTWLSRLPSTFFLPQESNFIRRHSKMEIKEPTKTRTET